MNQRISVSKQSVLEVTDSAADYAESRALVIRDNLKQDIDRASKSILGLLFILVSIIFSGIVAFIWLFAAIWSCPNRELILSAIVLIPLILSSFVYCRIKQDWGKVPVMKSATDLLSEDWKIFRHGIDSSKPNSEK